MCIWLGVSCRKAAKRTKEQCTNYQNMALPSLCWETNSAPVGGLPKVDGLIKEEGLYRMPNIISTLAEVRHFFFFRIFLIDKFYVR